MHLQRDAVICQAKSTVSEFRDLHQIDLETTRCNLETTVLTR